MASLKELHQLVHTLNKREKIQLNLYLKAFGGKAKNTYLKDYQCFVKYKDFNKEKITKGLNKVKARKNLSETNTNLYNFIVDATINANQNLNKKLGFLKEIQAIELMIDKGLFEQGKKKFDLLKTEIYNSSRNEKLSFYLLELENVFLFHQAKSEQNYNERIDLLQEQIDFVSKTDFTLKFKKLKTQLFALISKVGIPRSKEQQDKYLDLIDDKVLQTSLEQIPLSSYLDFFYAKHMLQFISNPKDSGKALDVLKQGLSLTKEKIDIKKDYMPYYVLSGMIMQTSSTGSNEAFAKESIKEFTAFQPFFKSKQHQVASKNNLLTANLLSCINFKNIEEGYLFMTENKAAILDKENLKFSPHAYVNYLNSARLCFLNKDYEQSLEFIDLLLEMKTTIRKSLLPSVNILFLLNHLKLENNIYLPYAIRSIYKSFLKVGQIYEPEKAVLSFFRTVVKKVDVQSDIEKLYEKLSELKKDPFNDSFFGNGDYLLWLEEEIKKPQQ